MSALPIFLQIGRIEGLLVAAGVLAPRRQPVPEPPHPPTGREGPPTAVDGLAHLVDRSTTAPAPVAAWDGRTAAHG